MKNKFFIIVIIFLLIIVFFSTVSFGAGIAYNEDFGIKMTDHSEITERVVFKGGVYYLDGQKTNCNDYFSVFYSNKFENNGGYKFIFFDSNNFHVDNQCVFFDKITDNNCFVFNYNKNCELSNFSGVTTVSQVEHNYPWGNYETVLYSTVDLLYADGTVFFKGSNNYSINLSTNHNTQGPIIAYSNYFNYSDAKKYECYISTDAKSWTLMNYETFNDTVNNIIKFRFNYKIYQNGCYYFKFLNKETNEDYYLSYNITNIVKNSSNSGFTDSGIPQPFCTYERVGDEFVIKTQSFSADDMQRFRCFYTKSPGDNYSSWDEMSMGSLNNTLTGETEYYFFFTVPKDSEDCIYYFVFYDNNSQQYGSPSSMNCYFDKMNEYADSLYPTVSKKNSRFNDLLKYFKERFGFLTYPFEFLVNFANRIFNINYSEPIIHIPELREPVNGNIIFNGLDFNFNSLLDNNTFVYIYNIYLVAIDFIIVVLFIFLCKKEIEEVFGNG